MKPLELFFKTGAVTLYQASKKGTLIKESYIASKISKSWLGEEKRKNANNFKILKQ